MRTQAVRAGEGLRQEMHTDGGTDRQQQVGDQRQDVDNARQYAAAQQERRENGDTKRHRGRQGETARRRSRGISGEGTMRCINRGNFFKILASRQCLDVIERIDFEDVRGPKVLEKREKQIVGMLGESTTKEEAAFLFKQMSAMPAARRLSVMPGVRLEEGPEESKVGFCEG